MAKLGTIKNWRKTILFIVLVIFILGLFPVGYEVYVHMFVGNDLSDASIDKVSVNNLKPPTTDEPASDSATPTSIQSNNVYANTTGTTVDPKVASITERVYVPNSGDGTVSVIDPTTYKVVDHYAVGKIPHHIAPSWDLSKLYVDNEGSNFMSVIDPKSGKVSGTVPVGNVYNLYFTPDGTKAVAVIERFHRIDFYDPNTWKLVGRIPMTSYGADHMDFSADGSYFLISTEWSADIVKVDVNAMKITSMYDVGGNPIDVKISPDGSVFYITNQGVFQNGVTIVDPTTMKKVGFISTGNGAHGLAVSRDAKSLYVTNRLGGTISVIDFATRKVTATWPVGNSPDMLQVSPDGKELWVSARFKNFVIVIDTSTGKVTHTIQVGANPHGLTYFPNVGRYSIGHNGVYR